MLRDHADRSQKLGIPQPQPSRGDQNLSELLVIVALISILMALASFALKLRNERAVTAEILRLTEQAIKSQQPACRIEVISGIKVEHCIRTVWK